MAQVLVRDLDPEVVERLAERARRNNRSLQDELRAILERASLENMPEAQRLAGLMRRRLAGRTRTDSARLQAEDRAR
jgi:plasmid stability protein